MRICTHCFALFLLFLGLAAAGCKKEPAQNGARTPEIILRTVDDMVAGLPDEGRRQILAMKSDSDMAMYHFGWGMGIRNGMGLWGDSELARAFKSIGIWHADDMSGILLTCVWRRLHRQPLDIPREVAFYEAYWKENKQLTSQPCPTCSKELQWAMSFPLAFVSSPERIGVRQPEGPHHVETMLQWYRCPEGHEFTWTSGGGLRKPDAAQQAALRTIRKEQEGRASAPSTP